ncbi:MAG TPA: hypothetical protein VKS21_11530, partial [Spirochaetota bacterium]|nr:hypothetical protein [Spirochaetota bacterium]
LHAAPHWHNFIFRMDFINNPGPLSLVGKKTAVSDKTPAVLNAVRKFIYRKVSRAQNIFINLNRDRDIKVKFRFRLDEELIKSEFKKYESLGFPDPEDRSVQDLTLAFSGFREAYQFMLRWLGCYSVLAPEWIIDVFQNNVEEALDELRC